MDLRETTRSEKASRLLLDLPETFYQDAQSDIKTSQDNIKSLSEFERDLMDAKIFSDIRDLASIKNIRVSKILKAAAFDAYQSEPKHEKEFMFGAERELYNNIIIGIRKVISP